MLYYARTIVKPENPIVEPTGKEAAHALEPLVASGVRIAARLRPLPDLPMDGALPRGYDHPQGSPGVTSIVRALGLGPVCYDRLLDFFHSPALDLNKLTRACLVT